MITNADVTRRTFLRAGATGIAGTVLVGASACSDSSKAPASSTSTKDISWFGYPSPLAKSAYGPALVEKTFGVNLTTYPTTYGDYATKLQSLLVGGDIPDVIVINDPNILQTYAAQGVLAEVDKDTIAKYAPRLYADIEKNWKVGWYYSLYNGKNYGYPLSYPSGVNSSCTGWRTDLLGRAGVDVVPDSLDEVEEAFAALKKIGVYGMSTNGTSYYAQFMTIFGAYGVMPTAWQRLDGHVINGAVAPQAKDALSRLASWYKKGYIDTEFMTTQANAQVQKFTAGKVGMWDYCGATDTDPNNPAGLLATARKADSKAEITLSLPPQGPGGRGSWAWGPAGWIVVFGKQLENDPAKLQKILSIVDKIDANEVLGTKLQFGEEGSMYTLSDSAKGIEGGWKWTSKYADVNKQGAAGIGTIPPAIGQPGWKVEYNAVFPDPPVAAIAEKYGHYGVYDLFGKTGSVPGSGKYLAELQNLKVKTYAQIISGASSISSFDTFVEQWNAGGGAELQKAAETLYQQGR